MITKAWKELIELIGFAAIVASLIFVGIELRQSRAIAISDGNLANAEIQIEANNAINANSAIWISGNSRESLSANDALIFENLVRNKAIHAFMEFARLDQVEFYDAAKSINELFAMFLYQNPGAREVWIRQEQFYSENFSINESQQRWRESVIANLDRLDRNSEE